MTQWMPPAEVLATLPCPWAELSEGEQAFVEAMHAPGAGVLMRAARSLEDAVSLVRGAEGVSPSGLCSAGSPGRVSPGADRVPLS